MNIEKVLIWKQQHSSYQAYSSKSFQTHNSNFKYLN